MAGHAQLKLIMTECSKTQIRLTGLNFSFFFSSTPLHCSIFCKNKAVFKVLLQHGKPDLELKNADGYTVLWLALQEVCDITIFFVFFVNT